MSKKISRRKFLVRGGIGTIGVVALGTYVFRNPLRRSAYSMMETIVSPYSGSGTEPNLWFEVTKDNNLIVHSPKVEMGQGTFTGIAQMVADEMDVLLDQVQVIAAATDTGIVDSLSTGGSLSIAQLWIPLREMSATMREMIKSEAAKKLNVEMAAINTKDGILSSGGKEMTYAEAVSGVTDWEVPDSPELKPMKDYKFIGKPVSRIDLRAKVFGEPIFGMDAEMPDMLHAVIVRPEHVGAKYKSANIEEAEKMPGVVRVVQMDNWVGIVANSYPQALSAKFKLKVDWEVSKKWTEQDIRDIISVGNGNEMVIQKEGSALRDDDEGVVTMEFKSPIGAHAQIEPNGAVAHVKDGKATIIISTQVIGVTQKQVAEALGIEPENVNVIPTYLGGGFGRRLNTSHAIEAAQLSIAVGKPVKYFFTRKEEFQNDMFRPPTHHVMKGKLGKDNLLEGLEHHFASGNVAIGSVIVPDALHGIIGTDVGAMRGGSIQYRNIPNFRAVQWHSTLPFATSWWRSLGLLANTFAIESFVDEMAIKAGKDAVEFRLTQVGDGEEGKRIKNVIKVASDKAGYTEEIRDNRAMGIAASIDGNSPCAHVVTVSIENQQIKVHKVVCVLDCGLAVNPDQVKAQCEGSIIMGMSAALHEKMTLKDGQLYPTIYGPYDMTLMKNSPREIEVHLVKGVEVPLPVGEPPLGPIAAAVANAVRRLTDRRITELPIKLA
ncbi:MAG: molybdopterin cofactor-binding domain-containing protein [Bacteroidota bacterium]